VRIALYRNPSLSYGASLAMWYQHSVTCTCHLTQVNARRLNPSQPGRYSIYLPRRDGRLSWARQLDSGPTGNRTHDRLIASPTPQPLRHRATRTLNRRWGRKMKSLCFLEKICRRPWPITSLDRYSETIITQRWFFFLKKWQWSRSVTCMYGIQLHSVVFSINPFHLTRLQKNEAFPIFC